MRPAGPGSRDTSSSARRRAGEPIQPSLPEQPQRPDAERRRQAVEGAAGGPRWTSGRFQNGRARLKPFAPAALAPGAEEGGEGDRDRADLGAAAVHRAGKREIARRGEPGEAPGSTPPPSVPDRRRRRRGRRSGGRRRSGSCRRRSGCSAASRRSSVGSMPVRPLSTRTMCISSGPSASSGRSGRNERWCTG